MEASLSLPNSTPWSTSNFTMTVEFSSDTSCTRPTRMPPTWTMLPRWMPLASVNTAV